MSYTPPPEIELCTALPYSTPGDTKDIHTPYIDRVSTGKVSLWVPMVKPQVPPE